jgi:hypothetical protein
MTGRLPFAVPDANKTVGTGSPRLADPRFKFPHDLALSPTGRDLVCRLLERNPKVRLGGGLTGESAKILVTSIFLLSLGGLHASWLLGGIPDQPRGFLQSRLT